MAKKRAHRPEGHRPPSPPPGSAPRPRPPAAAAARKRSARTRFEDASRPVLVRMRALPTFLLPMLIAVTLFLGLALPWPWTGLLLVAIGLFLAWLTALSWPATSAGSRALRIVVNISIIALGVLKVLGRI